MSTVVVYMSMVVVYMSMVVVYMIVGYTYPKQGGGACSLCVITWVCICSDLQVNTQHKAQSNSLQH